MCARCVGCRSEWSFNGLSPRPAICHPMLQDHQEKEGRSKQEELRRKQMGRESIRTNAPRWQVASTSLVKERCSTASYGAAWRLS
eukprot:gene11993-8264_t